MTYVYDSMIVTLRVKVIFSNDSTIFEKKYKFLEFSIFKNVDKIYVVMVNDKTSPSYIHF